MHACSNTTLSLSRKIERDSCSRSHATHHSSTASAHHHATMQSTSLLSLEFVFILFLLGLIHCCCTLKIKEKCEKSITFDPLLTPLFFYFNPRLHCFIPFVGFMASGTKLPPIVVCCLLIVCEIHDPHSLVLCLVYG